MHLESFSFIVFYNYSAFLKSKCFNVTGFIVQYSLLHVIFQSIQE